ncbi:MAG: NAD(P)-binding domain-containing protein, partial [Deltaproteobacteria bacterium]|nr:NAD(P)-binding domain-containing protein [Deltaproteobacteria bacterium]
MNANIKIGFVGGGNMATALIEGILKKKLFAPSQVGVFEPDAVRAKKLQKYKISLFPSNALLAAASPVLLLAIKPQQVGLVLENIAPLIGPKHLILSILAGIDTETFYKKLPRTTRLIRIMPNLCAQIAEGASALYASKTATAADRS